MSSSEEDHSPVARHRSSKPSRAQPSGAASDQDLPQHDPDPPYYRKVALSDIPSQYSEEVDTFRRILSLPDPRDSMPRSSTSVLGLDDEKGRQELRPRGPSSILPLSSVIKDAFDKLCPPPWGVDILFLLFSPSDVRCPASGVRCPASRMVSAHLKEKY